MRCRIVHRTRYDYGREVFLEPHLLRLVPRGDAAQRLLSFAAAIEPEPAGRTLITDAWGNTVLSVWFSGLTDHLTVTTEATVATLRDNPFDYLIEMPRAVLPVPLASGEAWLAGDCLSTVVGAASRTTELAQAILAGGATTPQTFAMELLGRMHARLATSVRLEPGLMDPDTVLARRKGACRDLALVFIAVCRQVGIPARFVSGYHEGDPASDERDLHAWAEAYLPGGGWRGFDPSLGLAVTDRHVALAAAPLPDDAAPVTGSFRGTGAAARLRHAIALEVSPANE